MRYKIRVCTLILVLLICGALSISASAAGESLVLSENGVEVRLNLPDGAAVYSQISTDHSIVYFGETQVVLEIEDTSVKKQLDFEKRVFEGLLQSYPGTTFFEELPELVTDMGTFTVCKLTYNDHNDEQSVSITAFCKLNYRYIYSITLRATGDVDYNLISQFANADVVKTARQFDMTMVGFVIAYLALGLLIIGNTFRKKHRRTRAMGTIVDFRRGRKSVSVVISYRTEDGEKKTGEHSFSTLGYLQFARSEGAEVEITYSEKKPRKVHIVAAKDGYIFGLVFVALAVWFACMMVFQL